VIAPRLAVPGMMVLASLGAADGGAARAADPGRQVERYRYEAFPLGKERSGRRERLEMEIRTEGSKTLYRSRLESGSEIEAVEISVEDDGRFLSGEKRTIAPGGGRPAVQRVWREDGYAHVERGPEGSGERSTHRIPEDRPLAVEGSLLLLLRSFPFGTDREWQVYMLDFSDLSITVSVRHAATETVTVPAGTFECQRIEVTVPIPLWRPRILYWLSREEPHFLVKQEGKRGPLTCSYVTVLTDRQ